MAGERTVGRDELKEMVRAVGADHRFDMPMYLVAESGQLWEGWIPDVRRVHVTVGEDPASRRRGAAVLEEYCAAAGLPLLVESPADVIPMPPGHTARMRDIQPGLRHFDPVSASFRAIARGDEPDYHLVLRYLEHDWIRWDEMTHLLDEVLPRFTLETIAQDPAEFRRKYRGLNQMWRAAKS